MSMEIKVKMCYSNLLRLMTIREFNRSIIDVKFNKPNIEHASMSGYIETVVEFTISDIEMFTEAYNYILTSAGSNTHIDLYNILTKRSSLYI